MKKILFCIDTLEGGGAEKVLVDILNNIDPKKYEIDLLVLVNRGIYFDKINKNIKVKTIFPKNYIFYKINYYMFKFMSGKLLYKMFISKKYDVEIAFMEGQTTKLISGSNNITSKKICWVHTDLMNMHWTKNMFKANEELECYNKFENIIFVSKDALKAFSSLFKNNQSIKKVIYNLIITESIIEKSKQIILEYDDFTVVSVGRLIEQKGYERLIRAHSELVKEYPHKLVIIGEGYKRTELENLISQLEVSNSIELKGFVENPYPYIKAANLFISSSITEGYPLVLLEAIALERPILATNITGAQEILDNGVYGMLCEDSTEGIENGMKKFLKNKEYLSYYTEQSKIRIKQFNYKQIIGEIENLL